MHPSGRGSAELGRPPSHVERGGTFLSQRPPGGGAREVKERYGGWGGGAVVEVGSTMLSEEARLSRGCPEWSDRVNFFFFPNSQICIFR